MQNNTFVGLEKEDTKRYLYRYGCLASRSMRAGKQLNYDFVSYLFKRRRLFIIQALHTIGTQAYVNLGLSPLARFPQILLFRHHGHNVANNLTHHQSPVADTNTYYFHAAGLMAHSGLELFRQIDRSPLYRRASTKINCTTN